MNLEYPIIPLGGFHALPPQRPRRTDPQRRDPPREKPPRHKDTKFSFSSRLRGEKRINHQVTKTPGFFFTLRVFVPSW